MDNIIVTGFSTVPKFAQGLVRDLRVRWALEEAGLPYEVSLIHPNDRHSHPYLDKNPFGMVPAFEADGQGLFESGAIVHHIALESEKLLPTAKHARAMTMTWMFAALNTVEPPIVNLGGIDLQHSEEQWAKQRRPAEVELVNARLSALATALEGRDYLVGEFTAADILMATVLRLARHTDLVASYPLVAAYLKRCEARPAFQKALYEQMAVFASENPIAA